MAKDYSKRLLFKIPSSLAKIFGVFKISIGSSSPIFLVLLENLSKGLEAPLIFDLKGSTHNRQASFEKYSDFNSMPRDKIYKDLDFLLLAKTFTLSSDASERITRSLELDSELLESYEIMDYSLLLLFERVREKHNRLLTEKNYFFFEGYIVRIGIIDYLQGYSSRKRLETTINTLRSDESNNFSCIPPDLYKKRFLEMVKNIIY